MSPDSFKIFVEQEINASLSDYTFNLQNELDIPLGESIIISEQFANTATSANAVYVINNIRASEVAPVMLTSPNLRTTYNASVGSASITAGSVTIKSNIMTTPVKFTIPFKEKVIRIGLNNLVTFSIKQIVVS
jgi:hypothetical protein